MGVLRIPLCASVGEEVAIESGQTGQVNRNERSNTANHRTKT